MGKKRKKLADTADKKRKKVSVALIKRSDAQRHVQPIYRLMEGLIEKHHSHLANAKIALAWRYGWGEDADGRLKLGTAKKGSDLERQMHGFDFVICLNWEAFNQGGLNDDQQKAVIDHELCHCQVVHDRNGEVKTDEEGRTCYRLRAHDVEEFTEIIARHGLYKRDIENFARHVLDTKKRPLLPAGKQDAPTPKPGGKQPELKIAAAHG